MYPPPRQFLPALLAAASLLAVLFTGGIAAAQDQPSCFGLFVDEAEAAGYRVQVGTAGSDVLVGGNTTLDMIIGLGGDDVLTGAGENDIICGGDGDDILSGGDGDDRLDGGEGADEIDGGVGHDTGRGAGGNDNLEGGDGNDSLDGGEGKDRLAGGDGDDELLGSSGADLIFGGFGDDRVMGGGGPDRIGGGPDRDYLNGGSGHDIISGNSQRDRLVGGSGDDVLDGDEGRDRLHGGQGRDRCDTTGTDIIRRCEVNFDGNSIERASTAVLDNTVRPDEPTTDPQPEPEPEPTTDPQPEPSDGPLPADQAPQGTNQFGWPLLTDTGVAALVQCESGGDYTANTGRFFGAAQWLPATWNSAARGSGNNEYDGILPHLLPAEVQDEVTKWWWGATRPNTQWPHCHSHALDAMNVLAPVVAP